VRQRVLDPRREQFGIGDGDRHKTRDDETAPMSDLRVVRADGTWHRTDILGCSYVDVAPVEEERTVDREALSDLDRCSTCTW
jgi:hypothetical protein